MSTRTSAPIEPRLRHNLLEFGACRIGFQRTLRIPDDGNSYPLPPGLGQFPVLPVSHFADRVPDDWREHGGVFIPMHQREALWIDFTRSDPWEPSAVKVGIGKVNAVTGEPWDDRLHGAGGGRKQDYLVVPDQPWLDGINVGEGRIRQFVAVPLGSDYTVEGQITGEETWGGIQLLVAPGRPRPRIDAVHRMAQPDFAAPPAPMSLRVQSSVADAAVMGLGAGGTMEQRIYRDSYGIENWQQERAGRVFVQIANAQLFTEITGMAPPPSPISAADYASHGLPWFSLYDEDRSSVPGDGPLTEVWSIQELDEARIGPAAPVDPSIEVGEERVVKLGPRGAGAERGSLDGEW
jgi:hypothetical protein